MIKPTDTTMLVTHAGCLDGTGSALMFLWSGGRRDNVVFLPPGRCELTVIPEEVTEVWFADLCPLDLSDPARGRPFKVFDHHLSNMRLHRGNPNCTFDMDRSGTSLMAHVLGIDLSDEEEPLRLGRHHLVKALEAYDLGRFDERDGVFLADLAATMPQSEMLDVLLRREGDVFIDEWINGQVSAASSMRRQYAEAAARTAFRTKFTWTHSTWNVAIAVAPVFWKNDVAQRLLDEPGTDMAVVLDQTTQMVSLRSRSDNVDCSYIAGLYGGGGHKMAAGFKADIKTVLAAVGSEIFG